MQERNTWSEHEASGADDQVDVKEIASQTKQKAVETMEEVKHGAQSKLDEQKQYAADRLSGVAGALRQTGHELEAQDEMLAHYADSFAEQVERMSNYLRERELSELFNDVRQVAQRQPEIFVAGALAAGFLVGRFLKSSSRSQSSEQYRGGQYSAVYTTAPYDTYRAGSETYQEADYLSSGSTNASAFADQEASRATWGDSSDSAAQEFPVTGKETYAE